MNRFVFAIMLVSFLPLAFSFTASVRSLKGTPILFLNHIPFSPLIYNACGENERTFHTIELAKKQGFDLVAYCCISTWITRPGEERDYHWVDEKIDKILARNPNALIIPRIGVGVPDWWKKEHPDAIMVFKKLENGRWVDVKDIAVIGGQEGISVASPEWKRDTAEALKKLVKHLEEKYGDHIIGYMPCGQNTGEWFYYDSWEGKLNCYEPAFEEAFRQWLKEKYKSEENLRKAWNEPSLTFDSVSLPSPEERMNATYGFFRDPGKERKLIDFHEFQNIAMASALED
ncbi:beta-galactosidase, partial [bacterium]|nr:beta-galactosidase [bacterium]